jgi:hypothetical protein
MARQFAEPKEIKVRTNIKGIPVSLVRKGRSERVARIYQQWRATDSWWAEEIERQYFMVGTTSGLVCDIFRDASRNSWFLSKIHD